MAAREGGRVGVGAEVGWGGGMGRAWRNGYVVFVDRFYKSAIELSVYPIYTVFRYPFHPRVTAVARKDPGHSVRSAGGRLQLNTRTPYVCDFA